MLESKEFGPVELKGDDGTGEFSATFSSFGVVDKDLDVVLATAIPNGPDVIIGAFGHKTLEGALPVGVGTIHTDYRHAWVTGQFLNTPSGRAHYQTLKEIGSLGRWSYGYQVDEASADYNDLKAFPGARRVLKKLSVFEVSPVLRAASLGTGTDDMKTDDELLAIADNIRRLREELHSDPELYAIWQQMQARDRERDLLDLRFI